MPESLQRDISTAPDGENYALYVSDRIQVFPSTTLELGLRWDRQNWIATGDDDQLSPCINLLHTFREGMDLRLTWGCYYQSQAINELQVGLIQVHLAETEDDCVVSVLNVMPWVGDYAKTVMIDGNPVDARTVMDREYIDIED